MIDIEDWLREMSEEQDADIADHETYQKKLFAEYVMRKDDNLEKRKELNQRFENLDILEERICHTILSENLLSSMRNWMISGQKEF